MTAASLSQQTTVPVKDVPAKDTSGVRKRKRRAPTGGATDDCFTCSKRNVKCDRRRPYCSQCLEVGNECSGYKTTLTWGVGVASRGKLRGLSLPIAKAPPVPREPKKSPPSRARSNSTISAISTHFNEQRGESHPAAQHRGAIDIPGTTSRSNTSSYHHSGSYDYVSMSHPAHQSHHHSHSSLSHGSWGGVSYASSMVHSPDVSTPRFSKFPLPIITDGLSSSVDSLSEVDYLSPMSQTYSREDMPPYGHSPSVLYDGFSGQQASPISRSSPPSLLIDTRRVGNSCPSFMYGPSDTSSSLNSHLDPFEALAQAKQESREGDSLSEQNKRAMHSFPNLMFLSRCSRDQHV